LKAPRAAAARQQSISPTFDKGAAVKAPTKPPTRPPAKPKGPARTPPVLRPLSVPPAPLDGPFWFLWRLDANRPRQRHSTLEAAVAEYDRLKLLNPEADYRIYEARRVDV
jgi:hypothetical protein